MRRIVYKGAFAPGRAWKRWCEFVLECTKKTRIIYMGINYVAMDRDSYNDLVKRRKK